MRLLGIGRNEYIDRVNKSKSVVRNGLWNLIVRKKTVMLEQLPLYPQDFAIEPWWLVCYGFITEDSLKVWLPFSASGCFVLVVFAHLVPAMHRDGGDVGHAVVPARQAHQGARGRDAA